MAARRSAINSSGGFDPRQELPVLTIPLAAIDPNPDNPNRHPPEQIDDLSRSLGAVGQMRTVSVWDRGNGRYTTVAGHGLIEGARHDRTTIQASIYPPQTPKHVIISAMIADNEHARHSTVDEQTLAELLERSALAGYDLHALGSSAEALDDLKTRLADAYLDAADTDSDELGEEGYDPDAPAGSPRRNPDLADGVAPDEGEAGALLQRLSLDLVTPAQPCLRGEVWWIASPDRARQHVLVCCDVFTAWQTWQPWLVRQCSEAVHDTPAPLPVLFMPFAGPFLALSRRARTRRLVLVQPDPFIAGHILSKAVEVYGAAGIARAERTEAAPRPGRLTPA